MNRPSFQFYPADWLGNSNLRRCTHAEKGVWLDVMCLMHDSGKYGLLRWSLDEIARAVGCQVENLHSLIAKGVMKGADAGQQCAPFIYVPRSGRKDGDPVTLICQQPGPLWYSSRMVRDEYVRQHRGESSRFQAANAENGETPKAIPKPAPMPPFGDGSSSSSSSSIEEGASQAAHAQSTKSKGKKSEDLHLADWLEQERQAGRRAISDYKAVWDFADKAGIPREWVESGWIYFKRMFVDDPNYSTKTQKDWRACFLNYVRRGWLHIWEVDRATGQYRLTLAGIQLQRELEAQEVAEA